MREVIQRIEGWTVESTTFDPGRGSAYGDARIDLRRAPASAWLGLSAPRVYAGDPEQLAGVRLTEAACDDEGTLELIFDDGTVLACASHPRYEAWEVHVESFGKILLWLIAVGGGEVVDMTPIDPPSR